jgi:hypothetical protein
MADVQPHPPRSQDEHTGRSRRSLLWLGVAAMLVLLGGWVYVLFIYDPGLMIDELADRTFPEAAERICAEARAQLDALPPAATASSPSERAEVVDASNEILDDMLAMLDQEAPQDPPAVRDGVREWIGDWRAYVEDRDEYATNLRTDPEARFLESRKEGSNRQISLAIDSFAEVNRMASCTTPEDVS